VRTTQKTPLPANSFPEVTDASVNAAQTVRRMDRNGEVTLSAPLKPMVVTVYDEHGGMRQIQLPPISFGSQRLTNNRSQVSMTNTKDW
jgi:type II secretory pathway component PulM